MDPENVLEELRSYFLTIGFNLTLSVNPELYSADLGSSKKLGSIFADAKSIILIGFGGKGFWDIFQKYLRDNPGFKTNNVDLIDNYSVLKLKEAANILDANQVAYKILYPFGEDALDLNFLRLGELGGAGVPSLLGILLHPVYGPWISLRGAIITDMEFKEYGENLSSFSPCPTCDKPCISACPVNTISESGWDWESCMKFRISDETCAKSCASRRACPYGEEEQYSEDQLQYHHKFVLKSVKKYFEQENKSEK